MAPRLELQQLLLTLCPNVYFQPPASLLMKYPAIVYKRDGRETEFGNNKPYSHRKRYLVTIIDQNPDSQIPEKVAALPMCQFDRFYTAENLNHDVYRLFF